METILITNDPWRARVAEQAGVDRIMVDLEILGKQRRQGHLDTVISRHKMEDVGSLRSTLSLAKLMVRVNPIHEKSADEIRRAIAAGGEIIMLPMFCYSWEVSKFIGIIEGRAKACLLFETGAALANIHELLLVDGIDEVHIGLNDLHLSLGLKFMFELFSCGLVDYMAAAFHRRGMKFGIGGISRLGRGMVPAELVMSEHVRLGSTQVILSRDYWKLFDENSDEACFAVFKKEMCKFRKYCEHLRGLSPEDLQVNSGKVREAVSTIVARRIESEMVIRSVGRADQPSKGFGFAPAPGC